MDRYFLEVTYKGTAYSGFQRQENAVTVQSEVEKALQMLHRRPIQLTGSSRTDAGVHAYQNFFHFDYDDVVHPLAVYKLNAILPYDIVIKKIHHMPNEAHSRFDAVSREYVYRFHRFKSPFLKDASYYYPYKLNLEALEEGTLYLKSQTNFFAFSKTNSQVKNFNCTIIKCKWQTEEKEFFFTIEANRFLRGMVRLVTGTLLKLGRGKMSLQEFKHQFINGRGGFAVPSHGLYLKNVRFPENYFPSTELCFTDF